MIADLFLDVILLHIAHHFHRKFRRKNTGILCLIFLEDVSLHRSPNNGQGIFLDTLIRLPIDELVTGET